jgi:hypothetical protein
MTICAKSTWGAPVCAEGRRRPPSAAAIVGEFARISGGDAVRRQAFDRERAGDADAAGVVVGAVVEQFDIGGLRDRVVDLALPGEARPPLFGMRGLRPVGTGLARDFPSLPGEC